MDPLKQIRGRLRRHGVIIAVACAASAPLLLLLLLDTTGSQAGKATAGLGLVVLGFFYGLWHLRTPPWLRAPEKIMSINTHYSKYGALHIVMDDRRDFTFRPAKDEEDLLKKVVEKLRDAGGATRV